MDGRLEVVIAAWSSRTRNGSRVAVIHGWGLARAVLQTYLLSFEWWHGACLRTWCDNTFHFTHSMD